MDGVDVLTGAPVGPGILTEMEVGEQRNLEGRSRAGSEMLGVRRRHGTVEGLSDDMRTVGEAEVRAGMDREGRR